VLAAFSAGYFVGTISAQTGTITIEPASFADTASYVISGEDTDGDGVLDIIYAKNGRTGQIEFSGSDAATVIQQAIDALTNSGKIHIKSGKYYLYSPIVINKPIVLSGDSQYATFLIGANHNDFTLKLQANYIVIRDIGLGYSGAIKGAVEVGASDIIYKLNVLENIYCSIVAEKIIQIRCGLAHLFKNLFLYLLNPELNPDSAIIQVGALDDAVPSNGLVFINVEAGSDRTVYYGLRNYRGYYNTYIRTSFGGMKPSDGIAYEVYAGDHNTFINPYSESASGYEYTGFKIYTTCNMILNPRLHRMTNGIVFETSGYRNLVIGGRITDCTGSTVLDNSTYGNKIIYTEGYVTENSGIATFSGDGTTDDFSIGAHGLAVTDPNKIVVKVTPISTDAIAASPCTGYVDPADNTKIRVKFASPPASGTDNVKIIWEAEVVP